MFIHVSIILEISKREIADMLSPDNRKKITPALAIDPSDLTIGDLLGALAAYQDKPLVFRYGDRPVKPGYHVT
ncbi:MAG: hypothetical protein E5W55_27175, partial [Mesorhizobium sp.]